ncbi:hypothetical protein QFZ94_006303 [Paraburkholderia sp. JPY465]
MQRDRAAAQRDDLRDHFVGVLTRGPIVHGHVPAARGEAECERAPDAARGAGNQHDAGRFNRRFGSAGSDVRRNGHLQCGDESESSPTR